MENTLGAKPSFGLIEFSTLIVGSDSTPEKIQFLSYTKNQQLLQSEDLKHIRQL
jgi:hypothetical protein